MRLWPATGTARVGMPQRDRMVLAGVERGARYACLVFPAIGQLVAAIGRLRLRHKSLGPRPMADLAELLEAVP